MELLQTGFMKPEHSAVKQVANSPACDVSWIVSCPESFIAPLTLLSAFCASFYVEYVQ